MFPNGQTFNHLATKPQSNSKSTFCCSFKNVSTSLMTYDVSVEVTIPYSTILAFVNTISSQNGAVTTADESAVKTPEKTVYIDAVP